MKKRFFVNVCILPFALFALCAQSSITSSVSSIKAELIGADNESAKILVSWEVPLNNDITSFIIYRSNHQITSDTIKKLKPVTTLTGRYTKYEDTVTNFRATYYYCVLTETINSGVFDVVIPSVNSTVAPISTKPQVDISQYVNESGRIELAENQRELVPLPLLNETQQAEKVPIFVPEKYLKNAKLFASAKNPQSAKQIQILKADEKPGRGDQYLLSKIVNGAFSEGKWNEALDEFEEFLCINRDENVVNRAYFYEGQIYYYKGDSRKAIICFMKSQNDYPIESRQWIDEVLKKIES